MLKKKNINSLYMSNNRVFKSLKSGNNCSILNKKFKIDENTNLNEDLCFTSGTLKQNDSVNDYMLSNFASCECDLNTVLDVSTENNGITIKDGYGISECNINKDTEFRHGIQKRRYKVDQQLFPRPFLTTPAISKGEHKPDLETKILSSLQSVKHSQMQNVTIENIYTPLNKNLLATVQNPDNLIQENADIRWVRGGIPSRQRVKDLDYFNRSDDN